MQPCLLKKYNERQCLEISRVYNELKWYVGEKLKRDPCQSQEDLKLVNSMLVEVILNGFGEYLSTLGDQPETRAQIIEENSTLHLMTASLETGSPFLENSYKLLTLV